MPPPDAPERPAARASAGPRRVASGRGARLRTGERTRAAGPAPGDLNDSLPDGAAMTIFLQLVASGVAVGMIYAAIAFGYQLTFATSKTLNFGQGEALALGALFGLTLAPFTGYWLMIPLVLVFGFALGAVVERLGVRPAVKIKSEYGWIMATIALGIIFRNLAENIWGRDDLKFPSPLPEDGAPGRRRPHAADGAADRRRRAADDARGRDLQSQVDLGEGGRSPPPTTSTPPA